MGKAGAVFGFLIIMVAFILTPSLLTAFDSWGYTESTTIAAITTGGGTTTGNATLGHDLYNANLDNIVSINSTNAADTAAPSSYSESTKALALAGLEESTTRSLTIDYRIEREDGLLAVIQPIMGILVILFLIVLGGGIAFVSWKKG